MSSAVFIPLIPSALAPVRARKESFLVGFRRMVARVLGTQGVAKAAVQDQALTVFQEAERIRAMADDLLKSDPDLAQDLYAAADRHEYEHAARV